MESREVETPLDRPRVRSSASGQSGGVGGGGGGGGGTSKRETKRGEKEGKEGEEGKGEALVQTNAIPIPKVYLRVGRGVFGVRENNVTQLRALRRREKGVWVFKIEKLVGVAL